MQPRVGANVRPGAPKMSSLASRGKLWGFIHHPVTEVAIILLIVLSTVLLVVEYSLDLTPESLSLILLAGDGISILFAIELSIRFYVAKKKGRFFRRYWADILAILPLLRPLRFFRLVRLFRLFRLGLLMSRRVAMLRGVLRVNVYELWVLVVITLITVVGAALMGYFFEPRHEPGFGSLESSFWWALTSIIAQEPIGGMPQTMPGRLVTIGLMLGGTMVFAVFTGVVSATMIDRLSGREEVWEMDLDELEDHIVICGWNGGARPLLHELSADPDLRGVPIVMVNNLEHRPALQEIGRETDQIYHVRGEHTKLDVLSRAGVERAGRAVVLTDSMLSVSNEDRDAKTVLAALTIERMRPGIHCTVELVDPSNEAHLRVAGVEAIVMRNDLSGRMLATACRDPQLVDVIMQIVSLNMGKALRRRAGPSAPTTFGALVGMHQSEHGELLIGFSPAGGEPVLNPEPERLVNPGDELIVIGR